MTPDDDPWGVEYNRSFHDDGELMYAKFSPVTGDVAPGWSHAEWTLKRMADCKPSGTRKTRKPFHG
jgi:hypothetical protein